MTMTHTVRTPHGSPATATRAIKASQTTRLYRRLGAAAAAAAAALAPASALAQVVLGPAVEPHGPGHISIAWQDTTTAPRTITLRAPGRPDVTVSALASGNVQRIEAEGLEPGVEYRYTIGEVEGRFVAPPAREDTVRFAVFGDTRSGHDVHAHLIRSIVAQRPDVCLTTGDDVEVGTSMAQWQTFFEIERPLMSISAYTGVRGNHDVGGMHERLFQIPSSTPSESNTYGSLELGPVHVVLVDTESPLTPGSAQYVWLERDLAAHEQQPLVVMQHRPFFSSGYHGGAESQHLADAIEPLYARYGVDLVFQGHDHDYERTKPIHGVTYVVTGGGGAPLYWTGRSAWTVVAEAVHHYVMVDATEDVINVRATRLDGSQLDAFRIDPAANIGAFTGRDPTPPGGTRSCSVSPASVSGARATMLGPVLGAALVGLALRRRARRRARG